jgi:CheY-like chemotaxis protein
MQILLVDDEVFQVEVLAMVLKKAGHKVKTVGDGVLALSALAADSFGIVITDLTMPQMDGLMLARKIKEQNAAQKVMLLTGSGANQGQIEHVDFVMTKPVPVEKLLETLAGLEAGS